MIDIHTHILPNIDNGSKSIEETFNLIREAKNAGFEAIVLTSHYKEGKYETDVPEREAWVNAIYENIRAKNIDMKIYLGNEIYMTKNIIKLLENEKAATINDTSYVLFELSLDKEPENLYEMIRKMQNDKIVPILAHPERYKFVQQDPELIYDLIQNGVLIQADYGSIIGQYGEKAKIMVKKLFQNNMVHMLGSNVHKQNTIYPKIPEILSKINEIVGEDKLKELTTTNPQLVLRNKRIEIEKPRKIELRFIEKLKMLKGESLIKIIKEILEK